MRRRQPQPRKPKIAARKWLKSQGFRPGRDQRHLWTWVRMGVKVQIYSSYKLLCCSCCFCSFLKGPSAMYVLICGQLCAHTHTSLRFMLGCATGWTWWWSSSLTPSNQDPLGAAAYHFHQLLSGNMSTLKTELADANRIIQALQNWVKSIWFEGKK